MRTDFINREKELTTIHRLLQDPVNNALISIFGEGGVGKTELGRHAIEQADMLDTVATKIIDFDLPEVRTATAVMSEIAKAYGVEQANIFLSELNELEEVERLGGASVELRQSHARDVERAFAEMVKVNAAHQRLFLVLDTLERIQDTDLFNDVLTTLQKLKNGAVAVLGRYNEQVHRQLEAVYGTDAFYQLPVEPFDREESQTYFRRLLKKDLDETMFRNLWLLSQGKPILMDLAAVWLAPRLSQLEVLSKADEWPGLALLELDEGILQKDLGRYREEFEYEVVGLVRQLNNPLNRAIFYMSLMEHPLTEETAIYLLELDERDTGQLIADLDGLFFVRANRTLHDEMRALVRRHVWPYHDHDGSVRQHTLKRLLAHTRAEKPAPGWPTWYQTAKELHYLLLLDEQTGFEFFLETFDPALAQRRYLACQLLLQTIESSAPALSEPMHWDILLRRARLHSRLGQEERMEVECRQLLDFADIPDAYRIDALSLLAYARRDRDPEEAAALYEEALDLARRQEDDASIARLLNFVAQVYRRLWQSGRAIIYFTESMQLSERLGLQTLNASVKNNLAYLYRQQGAIDRALNLALSAFVMRERLGDQEGLAFSNQTLGEIYRDLNDLTKARANFLEALQLFEALKKEQEAARVKILLANLARKEHQPELAERYISESLSIFEIHNDKEGRAQALNESGCEYRKRGREMYRNAGDVQSALASLAQAEKRFLESNALSRELQDDYRLADNLADLTLLYEYWYEIFVEQGHVEEAHLYRVMTFDAALQATLIARRNKFTLPESRAMEAIGHVYYAEKKFFKAFAQYYLQACLEMAAYDGRLHRYRVVFDRTHRRLLSAELPDETVRFIANYLARRWREEGKEKIMPSFVERYQDVVREWSTGGIR